MRSHHLRRAITFGALLLFLLISAQDANPQRAPATHTIYMSAIEPKGSTTTEKLAPPVANPATLSKGYGYKAPGDVDKATPERWEVASYNFVPGFVVVHRGDTVALTVFVVNGDQHEIAVLAPDGQIVAPRATWHRGREYRVSFVADKAGTYRLTCYTHAPTMTANILVLPR